MSPISAELILIVFAILASLAAASPLDLNKRVVDGYFTMCQLPNFSTDWHGPDFPCEHRVPWISGQCNEVPPSLLGYVQSARPEDDYGATCHLYSLDGCTGRVTPDIKSPGLNNFGDYKGDTFSWKCDCGGTCIDADATVTASFDPNATNVPITFDTGTPHPPAATRAA